MKIIILLILLSLIIALSFLLAFIWSVKSGQYDDVEGPPQRILFDNKTKN